MGFKTDVVERLAGIEGSLKEHMRRTDLLEKRLDSVWTKALTALSIISALVVLLKSLSP